MQHCELISALRRRRKGEEESKKETCRLARTRTADEKEREKREAAQAEGLLGPSRAPHAAPWGKLLQPSLLFSAATSLAYLRSRTIKGNEVSFAFMFSVQNQSR